MISLPSNRDRLQSVLYQLNMLGYYEPFVKPWKGAEGNAVGVPAWWKSGGGAWGCLLSHVGVLGEAVWDRLENYLVLEDDALLSPHFEEQFEMFMNAVPNNWDQLYFGGQNLLTPVKINSQVIEPKDMNRTHAFALRQSVYSRFGAHVMHAPDFISEYGSGGCPHIDHQLGRAHRRGDWRTYAPYTNLVGQRENRSVINGCWHPDKWWDWPEGDCYRFLPFVVIENDGRFAKVRGRNWRGRKRKGETAYKLHFGWETGKNKLTFREAWEDKKNPATLYNSFSVVAKEAFECRRIPAFYGTRDQVDFLKACWPGGTTTLAKIEAQGFDVRERLDFMADYPWNGLLKLREKAS